MATNLAAGFTPPDEEDPTQYKIDWALIEYPDTGGVSFTVAFSYGKDDGSGTFVQIGRQRQVTWSGADVVAKVSSPDPGTVNVNLQSIADQLLLDGGYVEV